MSKLARGWTSRWSINNFFSKCYIFFSNDFALTSFLADRFKFLENIATTCKIDVWKAPQASVTTIIALQEIYMENCRAGAAVCSIGHISLFPVREIRLALSTLSLKSRLALLLNLH